MLNPGNTNPREHVIHTDRKTKIPGLFNRFSHIVYAVRMMALLTLKT